MNAAADCQKIIGRAAVSNGKVYFVAYQPEDLACPLYGTSRLIEVADSCQAGGNSATLGNGLATAPVVDGRGNVYVGIGTVKPGTTSTSSSPSLVYQVCRNQKSPVKYKSCREKGILSTMTFFIYF
ncbi:hypothetical protein [Polynucleobacter necessarius]|uniref:hypothetical protein n=1 Tax=Polynucleobacter necessarius TaxID=576610 RepID=UPI001E497584|nr:hypothetical protein [Polynucleobacter necessarius]